MRSGKVRAGTLLLAVFTLLALIGPWLAEPLIGAGPRTIDYDALGVAPGATGHPLGTTTSGEDVLAQLLVGARGSVLVGLVTGVVATGLAILVGLVSGFAGGRTDKILTLFTNVMLTLPGLPLILIIAGYLQEPGPLTIGLLLGLLGWSASARYLRAQTMSLRGRDFVAAMRMVGESRTRLVFAEILPHLTGLISALFLSGVIGGVLGEAALAFLGIVTPDTVSWGTMISEAQDQSALMRGMWWWFGPPGLCIALLGSAIALLNFGIDEIGNPRLRVRTTTRRRRVHTA
ncbi:ABC transporter permease [Nonomuraea sp. NBC_01738]|uniref:ABC transporter permease n=1 Tax=Nonomuraea sp. NBC_01738 TaxID=2976003 RepID=UPI002E14B68E|nr:ABC transporter permease [Nonomuraea sp. NBC_01738]